MQGLPPDSRLEKLEIELYEYEASESVEKTGAGARREGDEFEKLVGDYWKSLKDLLVLHGVSECRVVRGANKRKWYCLENDRRKILLPCHPHEALSDPTAQPFRWLDLIFRTEEIVAAYPGLDEATLRFAPQRGPYAGESYHEMYKGLSTKFDDTILLIEDDILKEKWLLEYKTAKSSKSRQIDGNAHERLSFQAMQFLEVAVRYTKCRFVVIANGAFVRYRNKYHVNFHIQAERLSNFGWFHMQHACSPEEYRVIANELWSWIQPNGSLA